ncbi:TolC family protein [Herbaspirillum sp. alder98]|uniref:TolC family protein n=1 Tax=Herbaspirillum sp. alder98 TaxID=2913096 RepID=UPI001CD87E91|nr:TolC family protein [Herbaspirillum sp. alder98]MCA1325523.1 TolC family protein [Herbaspirillum sp. alder98]
MPSLVSRPPWAVALCAGALLSGCAQLPADGGIGPLQEIASQRLGQHTTWNRSADDDRRSRDQIAALLDDGHAGRRLSSADDAVQIALLNNPELQAGFAALGMAQADLVQASRLPNPGFSFARSHTGDDIKIERGISLALMKLLSMPVTTRIAERGLEQTRLLAAERLLKVAAQTRQAYYRALSSQQMLAYQEQVLQAAQAAHTLAARMAERGNSSRLDAAREQLFYAETQTRLARARREATQEREALARLLGLPPDFDLPARLPALPDQLAPMVDIERQAMAQRLDVQAARSELAGLQDSLGLTRATRLVNVLDLGYQRTTESGRAPEIGYQVSIEIPLFDWGQARVAKAEAIYLQGAQRLAATALDARAQARLAWRERDDAFALARRYQQQILPLRRRVADENLLRYNGMLISVFELLADAREQATTVIAAIEAERDFWIADAGLQLALGGPPQGTRP